MNQNRVLTQAGSLRHKSYEDDAVAERSALARVKRSGLNASQSRLCPSLGDPLADELCRDGSEQNSVAVVAGREHQTIDIHRPQDGQLIRRAGPQAAPGLDDFRLREFGHEFIRGRKDFFDAARSDALFISPRSRSCCPRPPSAGCPRRAGQGNRARSAARVEWAFRNAAERPSGRAREESARTAQPREFAMTSSPRQAPPAPREKFRRWKFSRRRTFSHRARANSLQHRGTAPRRRKPRRRAPQPSVRAARSNIRPEAAPPRAHPARAQVPCSVASSSGSGSHASPSP